MSRKILQHIDVITRHRDEALLDVTVIQSLLELLRVERIRLHSVTHRRGSFRVASTEWSDAGGVRYFPDLLTDADYQAVSDLPSVAKAIERRKTLTVRGEAGVRPFGYFFPVFVNQTAVACFEIEQPTRLSGSQAEIARGILGLYRNYLSLLEDSQQDKLTGLFNRQTFDRSLNRMLAATGGAARSQRSQERRGQGAPEHWLAIIDIDHFKRINDRFGHLYGDEVLILVANLMRNSFRQQDRLYRFGGEEFVVLLRKCDFTGACNTLERFRRAFESHAFPEAVGRITASIGFARIDHRDNAASVLGHADEALYYAKGHGRNQVQSYERLIEAGELRGHEYQTEAEIF